MVCLAHWRDVKCLDLIDCLQHADGGPVADYDPWDAQQEGLSPKFEQLAREVVSVSFCEDTGRRFELNIVDWFAGRLRLAVPYWWFVRSRASATGEVERGRAAALNRPVHCEEE